MEKKLRPKPISEAERQWINEQGDFGKRCFAYPSSDAPSNNVFSLDYYRAMTRMIIPLFTIQTGHNVNASNELRRKHVASMRANFAIEEMHPDAEDLALQERYIDGTASLDDLIKHAHAYAAKHASSG